MINGIKTKRICRGIIQLNKPVVDVARDAQCCVHTRDKVSRTDTQMDRWMDRHCATIRASLACASRANSNNIIAEDV